MTKVKDINEMTIKEFRNLPGRNWDEDIELFDQIIILPCTLKDGLHDSGYRLIDFVAVKDGIPLCRLSGCSDVINLCGIGGYNQGKSVYTNQRWNMDCLSKSGLLRLWCDGHQLKVGVALSSFELLVVKMS